MDADAKTKFTRDELLTLQAKSDFVDGSWEYVECRLCSALGWKHELVHEASCLLADDAIVSVQLIGILDPALICTKCCGGGRIRLSETLGSILKIECDKCGGSGRA